MSSPVRRTTSLAAARRLSQMRRALAFGGMLAAVGGLVAVRSALAPAPSAALGTTGLAARVTGGAGHHVATSTHPHHAPSTAAKPSPKPVGHRQVVGNAYNVGYGVVQVRVTFAGTRIADISAMSLPQGGRSTDISSYAAPQLRREALSAQSARIDSVSGASYTSAGYAESLQSALDKAARGQ
jgi:uncharacterized protein with FMN-binding domain